MAKEDVDETKVAEIVQEMEDAFGEVHDFANLSPPAQAAFREGFTQSVRDALENRLSWEGPTVPRNDDYPTWGEFVLYMIGEVASTLVAEGPVRNIPKLNLIDVIRRVGRDNGCPPEGVQVTGRWCSFFIKPGVE